MLLQFFFAPFLQNFSVSHVRNENCSNALDLLLVPCHPAIPLWKKPTVSDIQFARYSKRELGYGFSRFHKANSTNQARSQHNKDEATD